LPNPLSLVENSHYRFLIFDAPNDENLPLYITELNKHHVHHLVRACDSTYAAHTLKAIDINVHEMPFSDGGVPSDAVVNKWLSLLAATYKENEKETIGVHCIAGKGRAPVLVAIALIEGGLAPVDAIKHIRDHRKGSLNMKQQQWLTRYKPRVNSSTKLTTIWTRVKSSLFVVK